MTERPSVLPLMSLPPDEVHVWITEPERITDPRLLEAYLALLDRAERERHQRFHFEKHRRQYLVSHALVRLCLSRYAAVPPEAWSFVTNDHGCPRIAGEGSPRLRFNLSHTDGMAICAVTSEADVGVDVEDAMRPGETVGIADRFFAPAEVAALRGLPVEKQRERFFEYWTLKEAYIKARGMGLSLPLEHFAFELQAGQSPRISFDARLRDDPETWRFRQWRPSERHQAALAVRRPSDLSLQVRCQRTVPLSGDEPPEFIVATY
ncbi:4'-phosphopantetheinyl transferase family protein [Hyalangium rubrum]|uniref:4'-phosphopantetheinyl transferase superfamily protein n=1 Tax=Hyalangium rubrum TaxID=3103134 RepID=A0ABU5HEF2_9BACT|nr:4'-phosphopantetheinyl transferase superfamily protein [Hyalangium sp. s54d21]MDY7231645.1 4'-phosphopantetheinyl transferase superfamily protein [Hyalangium sp. s54d21]